MRRTALLATVVWALAAAPAAAAAAPSELRDARGGPIPVGGSVLAGTGAAARAGPGGRRSRSNPVTEPRRRIRDLPQQLS